MRHGRRTEPRVRALGRLPAQPRRERPQDPLAMLLRVALKGMATVSIALLAMAASTRLQPESAEGARQPPMLLPHVAARSPAETCGQAREVDPAFLPWRAGDCAQTLLLIKSQ